jgi:hypothetical protein
VRINDFDALLLAAPSRPLMQHDGAIADYSKAIRLSRRRGNGQWVSEIVHRPIASNNEFCETGACWCKSVPQPLWVISRHPFTPPARQVYIQLRTSLDRSAFYGL